MWTGDKVFFDLVSTAVGDRYALQAFIDATRKPITSSTCQVSIGRLPCSRFLI